jgi:Tol biopolymer transport system component
LSSANAELMFGARLVLTIASGAEAQPSVARGTDGTARLALTTASALGNTHIWALPVRANEGKVTGEPQRLTTSLFENQYASISADGGTLVFSSTGSGTYKCSFRTA